GASSEAQREEAPNFRVLFHMLLQDQNLPDLIWNQETRQELRVGLESELQGFERQQRMRGSGGVAWNFHSFRILYPSLAGEQLVGGMSLRLMMEASDSFLLASIDRPKRFCDLLFRRALCDWQKDGGERVVSQCLQCLERLYGLQAQVIGPFDDIMVLVGMLKACTNREIHHCLLKLVATLARCSSANVEKITEPETVEVICELASSAHMNACQVGNMLSREMDKQQQTRLMLTASSDSPASPEKAPSPRAGNPMASPPSSRCHDAMCPRIWYTAPGGRCPPTKGSEEGPYLLSQ
ncbi:unnamed protein product, partial [Chrysoparadoxa australica]